MLFYMQNKITVPYISSLKSVSTCGICLKADGKALIKNAQKSFTSFELRGIGMLTSAPSRMEWCKNRACDFHVGIRHGKIVMISDNTLCARHNAKNLMWTSLSSSLQSYEASTVITPFWGEENWGLESLSNLPKPTQLVCRKSGFWIHIWAAQLQSLHPIFKATLDQSSE